METKGLRLTLTLDQAELLLRVLGDFDDRVLHGPRERPVPKSVVREVGDMIRQLEKKVGHEYQPPFIKED